MAKRQFFNDQFSIQRSDNLNPNSEIKVGDLPNILRHLASLNLGIRV